MIKFNKYKLISLFLIFIIINDKKYLFQNITNYNFFSFEKKSKCNLPELYSINKILSNNNIINQNNILILEAHLFHYECTPGFAKYFIDLGFNVDIIIHRIGITSFCFFGQKNRIRIFFYENIEYLKNNSDYFSLIAKKYNHILIETIEPNSFELYEKLNFNKTLFVFHNLNFLNNFKLQILKNYQLLSLGNLPFTKKVNPHYFGPLKLIKKNRITTFFITSTIYRSYKFLILAAKKIKEECIKFHIIVVGKVKTFSQKDIPLTLKNNFTFKYRISYFELYKEVYRSDYIIINLNPNIKADRQFKKTRLTGSAQLSYGFLKPVLIHEDFADFYNFSSSNSMIYNSFNFTRVMRDAINMGNKNYRNMQKNLFLLSKIIYKESLLNLKSYIK